MIGVRHEVSDTGVPQGSPLSPLLGNIMLDELDKELEGRGHPFVRYADDGLIFCRSAHAAARVQTSITCCIETCLYLRMNNEKTRNGEVRGMKFLGYSFYYSKGACRLYVTGNKKDALSSISPQGISQRRQTVSGGVKVIRKATEKRGHFMSTSSKLCANCLYL